MLQRLASAPKLSYGQPRGRSAATKALSVVGQRATVHMHPADVDKIVAMAARIEQALIVQLAHSQPEVYTDMFFLVDYDDVSEGGAAKRGGGLGEVWQKFKMLVMGKSTTKVTVLNGQYTYDEAQVDRVNRAVAGGGWTQQQPSHVFVPVQSTAQHIGSQPYFRPQPNQQQMYPTYLPMAPLQPVPMALPMPQSPPPMPQPMAPPQPLQPYHTTLLRDVFPPNQPMTQASPPTSYPRQLRTRTHAQTRLQPLPAQAYARLEPIERTFDQPYLPQDIVQHIFETALKSLSTINRDEQVKTMIALINASQVSKMWHRCLANAEVAVVAGDTEQKKAPMPPIDEYNKLVEVHKQLGKTLNPEEKSKMLLLRANLLSKIALLVDPESMKEITYDLYHATASDYHEHRYSPIQDLMIQLLADDDHDHGAPNVAIMGATARTNAVRYLKLMNLLQHILEFLDDLFAMNIDFNNRYVYYLKNLMVHLHFGRIYISLSKSVAAASATTSSSAPSNSIYVSLHGTDRSKTFSDLSDLASLQNSEFLDEIVTEIYTNTEKYVRFHLSLPDAPRDTNPQYLAEMAKYVAILPQMLRIQAWQKNITTQLHDFFRAGRGGDRTQTKMLLLGRVRRVRVTKRGAQYVSIKGEDVPLAKAIKMHKAYLKNKEKTKKKQAKHNKKTAKAKN